MNRQMLINQNNSYLMVIEGWNFQDKTNDQMLGYLSNLDLSVEPVIKIYGKECHQKRDVGFFSNESEGYRYSGQIEKSQPLPPLLSDLLDQINFDFGTSFNGILINKYKNGEKYISAHSDNEKSLDKKTKMVISIAFGATRLFRIRNKVTKEIILDIPHKPGNIIIMGGDFQSHYTHEIPVEKKIKDERISVTFRHHLE